MKKIFKSIMTMALLAAMVLGTTMTSNAAIIEASDVEVTATPRMTSTNINSDWTTVLESSTGFNRDIHIRATTFTYNGLFTTVPCDIRMLGRNGNVLWSSDDAVPGQNQEVTFWCGADVYKVQLRTQVGDGVVNAW